LYSRHSVFRLSPGDGINFYLLDPLVSTPSSARVVIFSLPVHPCLVVFCSITFFTIRTPNWDFDHHFTFPSQHVLFGHFSSLLLMVAARSDIDFCSLVLAFFFHFLMAKLAPSRVGCPSIFLFWTVLGSMQLFFFFF